MGKVESLTTNAQMAFSVDGDLLATVLKAVMRAGKSALYIRVDENCVEFKTCGRDFIAVEKISEGVKIFTTGETLINNAGAKIFVKAVNERARYTLTASKSTLTITNGDQRELSLSCCAFLPSLSKKDAERFKPFQTEYVMGENVIALAQSELKQLLKSTLYAAATVENSLSRPVFTQVNFKAGEENLTLTAATHFQIAQVTTTAFTLQGDFNCNIDSDVLWFILPLLKNKDVVQITCGGRSEYVNEICIKIDTLTVNARCVKLDFPDTSQVISQLALVKASLNRQELIQAVKFCSPFADEHGAINLRFEKDAVTVNASHKAVVTYKTEDSTARSLKIGGSAVNYVQAEVDGVESGNAVGDFTVTNLLGMLGNLTETNITIELSEQSITVRGNNKVAVIAPIKESVHLPVKAVTPSLQDTTTIDITSAFVESVAETVA